jgi:hypothetical protein
MRKAKAIGFVHPVQKADNASLTHLVRNVEFSVNDGMLRLGPVAIPLSNVAFLVEAEDGSRQKQGRTDPERSSQAAEPGSNGGEEAPDQKQVRKRGRPNASTEKVP